MHHLFLFCLLVGIVGNATHRVLRDECTRREQNVLLLFRSVVIIYCFIRTLSEVSELLHKKAEYFSMENFLDWTFLVTSVIFVWNWERDQQCVVTNWQWQVSHCAGTWCRTSFGLQDYGIYFFICLRNRNTVNDHM